MNSYFRHCHIFMLCLIVASSTIDARRLPRQRGNITQAFQDSSSKNIAGESLPLIPSIHETSLRTQDKTLNLVKRETTQPSHPGVANQPSPKGYGGQESYAGHSKASAGSPVIHPTSKLPSILTTKNKKSLKEIIQGSNTPQQIVPETKSQSSDNQAITIQDLEHKLDTVDRDAKELLESEIKTLAQETDIKPILDRDTTDLPLELQEQVSKDDEAAETALQALAEEKEEEEEKVELQFEDADLINFIKQIEELYEITFITDEAIQPIKQGAKAIKGNKITFKTHKPMSKQEAWGLLTTFLEIAGFTIVPQADPSIYRIQTLPASRKAPIPAYIGIDPEKLPDNDQIIRYVYFISNSTTEAIKNIVNTLKSKDAPVLELKEQKAILITDKAYNIKTLMKIVKELDKVSAPQAMTVIKLKNADATDVKALYDSLIGVDDKMPYRPFTTRKPSSLYFPDNTRIITEPRTNSLILLGTKDAIEKIEDFIKKYVDVELDQPYSPLHTYQLKYADAKTVADIMTNVTKFGEGTAAGQVGGVRGQDKFLQPMVFTPETETNRLIIRGRYEDYLIAKEIIDKLDEQQPQVAIEVLILSLSANDARELGVQFRNKVPGVDGLIGKNVNFQTSGLFAGGTAQKIVEKKDATTGAMRLLGNMLDLVTNAGTGNTIVSLGRDICDVWGVLQILQTSSNAQIVSNPFLIATNKTRASIAVGEERRVKTADIITDTGENPTFDNDEAQLKIDITPQINSDGMIVLDLSVDISAFTVPIAIDPSAGEKTTKKVVTQTIVADKEVIALGGLVKNTIKNDMSKTPVLGDIPILGWLFKNKRKTKDKENLLILISTRIINPEDTSEVNRYTQERIKDYHGTMAEMHDVSERHDPIHRLFFAQENKTDKEIEDFIFERGKNNKRRRHRNRRRKKKNDQQPENNHAATQGQQESGAAPPLVGSGQTLQDRLASSSGANELEKPTPPTHVNNQAVADTRNAITQETVTPNADQLNTKIKEKKKRSRFSLTNLFSRNSNGADV